MTARTDIDWELVGMVVAARLSLSPLARELWEQSGRDSKRFAELKGRVGFLEIMRKEAGVPRTTFWRARQGRPLTEWNFNKILKWTGWPEAAFVIGATI